MNSISFLPNTRRTFSSLYWKLSGAFLAILAVLAVAYVYITAYTADMHFQEANQRLNAMVAQYIAAKVQPIVAGKIDRSVMAKLFDEAMMINPSVEVYLLDPHGRILAYSAPDSVIRRSSVSLAPITEFLDSKGKNLILGDDPRNTHRQKAFSAAPLEYNARMEGYLYVILGGEEYDSALEFVRNSYIMQLGLRTIGLTILAAAVIGLLAFRYITKGLRTTVKTVQEFQEGKLEARIPSSSTPEIDELAKSFNAMADTIVRNIEEMKTMDNLRRDLVANVSHDLRTPLVTIHGYVETILMKAEHLSETDRQRYLTIVLHGTERLRKLVEELFELSKLEARQTRPNLEQFSIAELVQDIVQKYQILAEQRHVTVKAELRHDLPPVTADIALIERVFQNLIDNAIKFTPENGVITIKLESAHDKVNVDVSDTGHGIPPEELPHIFERYQRGREYAATDASGTGLGLAIVKKILEIHGISVSVASRIEEGTAFSFSLPAVGARE